MGDVIQMFKNNNPEPPDEEDEFNVRDVLTEELEQSVLDVQAELEVLWLAHSRGEFIEMIRRVKDHVAQWPSDG